MNAVEIEEAVSALVEDPFDAEEFPYQFLAAFGNKATTIKRLRSGSTNKSDVASGVLQRNNIHIAICDEGMVEATLPALRESTATASQKAKYILATDGETVEAESIEDGETLACGYAQLADHFGFFLPLAGITTVKQIRENAFDIKATSRLNKLYVELLKQNPEWEGRREALNHFFARLIFCFFAEDTNIFHSKDLFTATIEQMTASDSSNTHEVIAELFRAMNTKHGNREDGNFRPWAGTFPYVNGGLFTGSLDVPRFSKIARSYLLHIGNLDWTMINPDIFGSMIQAVAEDEERGELGMHYTSVPNILKVLNPLFLDELREKLEEAGDGSDQGSKRKLLNLRNRMARIRVFDPACGSGNFLVIAYKEMREIEAEVNQRRGEADRRSDLPLTNFRGIEIRHFAAEIARLALIIAEYQCDVLYRGPKLALAEFLPLEAANWITNGNALRLDWTDICPSTGSGVSLAAENLYETPLEKVEIDFENDGGEVYLCGNPPYKGSKLQSTDQKQDLVHAWTGHASIAKNMDYVSGWIAKFLRYQDSVPTATAAFVTTNSLSQGQQASQIWPVLQKHGVEYFFARTPFHWSNLASRNAGVTVIVLGIAARSNSEKRLYDGNAIKRCTVIGPYLVPGSGSVVLKAALPLTEQSQMYFGNMPRDGGHLFVANVNLDEFHQCETARKYVYKFVGSEELIHGRRRYCLWIKDNEHDHAVQSQLIERRLRLVAESRRASKAQSTQSFATRPHRFVQIAGESMECAIVVPRVSAASRRYLPADYLDSTYIVGDRNFALYDSPLWNFAVVVSTLHRVWIATVCGRMRMDYLYSNTLGWNTFPIPPLTDQNRRDLTRCAENILLARESYWPATIADMYDPDDMDHKYPDLRAAHEANDETLERIYIGRRFKNDTERLEKLFAMYTEMIGREKAGKPSTKKTGSKRK